MYVAVHVAVAIAVLVLPAKRPNRHLMAQYARKFSNSCATHQYGQSSRFPHCWRQQGGGWLRSDLRTQCRYIADAYACMQLGATVRALLYHHSC